MFRSYLVVSLSFLLLLTAGGCAKKNMTDIAEPPALTETADVSEPSSIEEVIAESPAEPVVQQSVVAVPDPSAEVLEIVYFDYDSYELTERTQRILRSHAELLMENQQVKAIIEGHCDERGSDEYNLALGERRALATKNYLAEQGVAPERLAIISYGEERPAIIGQNQTAWEQNRRVEFR